MIYLIETTYYNKETKEILDLLKIGYTKDSAKEIRFMAYKMHNPGFNLLFEIHNATEDHEKRIQYKFRNLLYENYGREWFKYDEEIIDFFKNIKSLEELDKLPKNPIRGDQIVLLGKRETRKILSYFFNTKEEIENYLDKLVDILGDTISYDTSLKYITEDQSIDKDKLNHYLEVIESRKTGVYCKDNIINQEVSKFMKVYDSYRTMYDKLRLLCEYGLSQNVINIVLSQLADSDDIKSYYLALGSQRLKALGYSVTRIKRELGIVTFSWEILIQEIYSNFKEGEKYTLSSLKNKLSSIYSSINYSATPKANDIEKYFRTKEISVYEKKEDGSRKRIKAYELLKSREQELMEELKHIQ